jgi:hypothetical protein
MQRYYFHFMWPDDAVFDPEGVEFENFQAAYHHACGLVQQVRSRFPATDQRWWIDVIDGVGASTAVLPAMVPGARLPKLRGSFHHLPRGE